MTTEQCAIELSMTSLHEWEQQELQAVCAEAERLAAEGDFRAGQSLLVLSVAERLRSKDANEPHGAALIDAWIQALREFVDNQGTPSLDLNQLD